MANKLTDPSIDHRCEDLVTLFNECFAQTDNTILTGGGEEPLYQPACSSGEFHQIIFTRDYFASALHEVAHWCVAGVERRQQVDYGYWYAPDGRDPEQQARFEQVEVKPQAMEWVFSVSARYRFRVSADNLTVLKGASESFKNAIYQQVQHYCSRGLPPRAERFMEALVNFYRRSPALQLPLYERDQL